jgi:hypothetical protein
MANQYIATKNDLNSSFNLGKAKSIADALMDEEDNFSDELAEIELESELDEIVSKLDPDNLPPAIIVKNPNAPKAIQTTEEDLSQTEDDFEFARKQIKESIQQSKEVLAEYAELVKGVDQPRAFEVYAKLAETHVALNQQLINIHEQKQKIKNNSSKQKENSGQTNIIQNQQNITISPMEAIRLAKGEKPTQ